MHIYELDTPSVVIDLDVLEKHIKDMPDLYKKLGIKLRSHTKSHKILQSPICKSLRDQKESSTKTWRH
ncbi:MAG: hypothetical protein OTJ43_03810 [Dehalococcoidia bacterium]|nr:hypothetical protein [Dehalococcoidia bacterium]